METPTNRKRHRVSESESEQTPSSDADESSAQVRKRRSTRRRSKVKDADPDEEFASAKDDPGETGEDDLDPGEEDDEYFEDDVDPLTTIVVDSLVKKFSLSKEEAKVAVKEALRGKSILTDEYSQSRPADQNWKVGLDPHVVRRLEPELIDLREELATEKLTIVKILTADLAREHKKKALEWYDALQNIEPYTADYLQARDDLMNYIRTNRRTFPQVAGGLVLAPEEKERQLLVEEQAVVKLLGEHPSYRQRILELNATREVKARIYQRWLTFKDLNSTSDEYGARKQWLEHALSLPYNQLTGLAKPESPLVMNGLLCAITHNLNRKVYGLAQAKQELLQVLAQRLTNPLGSHPNLALVGASGTGKSLIYSSVAEAYGIPFERVSLGGLTDSAVLKGHSSTYVGAEPGLMVKILQRIKCSNGMVFFDELDKLGTSESGREVQYALLHLMDATTNKDYRDTYLADIPLDLSKLWFVCAMNHSNWLDSAMRDRLHIIRLKSYTSEEKKVIARDYLLPAALTDVGLPPNSVTFTPDAIHRLVASMPSDTNVRPLKDELSLIVGRVNLYRSVLLADGTTGDVKLTFNIPRFCLPLTVTAELLKCLGTTKDNEENELSKRMMYL
jgi:ATPase family associated with various cellular activities (AAA)